MGNTVGKRGLEQERKDDCRGRQLIGTVSALALSAHLSGVFWILI